MYLKDFYFSQNLLQADRHHGHSTSEIARKKNICKLKPHNGASVHGGKRPSDRKIVLSFRNSFAGGPKPWSSPESTRL